MYDYQMFRVVMRGFDRDEVLRYLRTHDEELNQRIAALEKELADCGCKVVVVGDASTTKNGYKNIREGFNAGNAI